MSYSYTLCTVGHESLYPIPTLTPVRTAHWMRIQCGLIASALQTRKTKSDPMRIEPIHFWRWTESGFNACGLEWNVSFCVVVCLQLTSSYLGKRRRHAHILLSLSTLQNHSADAIKSGLKPVQAMCIQSRSDVITVRTGLKVVLVAIRNHLQLAVRNLLVCTVGSRYSSVSHNHSNAFW